MSNTYEVHILIDPNDEEKLRLNFNTLKIILKDNHLRVDPRIMATITSTGINKRQPMITFCITNQTEKDAINIANKVQEIMANDKIGLNVVRVKVEQLLSGDNSELDVMGENYFESHVKIGKCIPDKDIYRDIATTCLKYGTQLLINPYSNVIAPVTTFRKYNISYNEFITLHDELCNELTNKGFSIYKIHIEKGIMDTNVYTDREWLFHGNDFKTSITEINEERVTCPVF